MKQGINWLSMLPSPVVCGLATLGPVGYWGKAPGTNGSIAGVLWYTMVFHFMPAPLYLIVLAATAYLAVLICGEAEKRLFKRDPGEIILDEFISIPLCFLGLQGAIASLGGWAWVMLLLGFGLFRLFDILKPFGIKKLQHYPGGWGVVIDDLAAALATCLCLHIGWLIFVNVTA